MVDSRESEQITCKRYEGNEEIESCSGMQTASPAPEVSSVSKVTSWSLQTGPSPAPELAKAYWTTEASRFTYLHFIIHSQLHSYIHDTTREYVPLDGVARRIGGCLWSPPHVLHERCAATPRFVTGYTMSCSKVCTCLPCCRYNYCSCVQAYERDLCTKTIHPYQHYMNTTATLAILLNVDAR
jgi:hypothetical protein